MGPTALTPLPCLANVQTFDHGVDGIAGRYARTAVAIPLLRPTGEVMGVLETLNKQEQVPHFSEYGQDRFINRIEEVDDAILTYPSPHISATPNFPRPQPPPLKR